jgi:hypothetical protein
MNWNLLFVLTLSISIHLALSLDYCSPSTKRAFSISTNPTVQNSWPSVSVLASKELEPRKVIITWQSNTDESGFGIYGRLYQIDFSGAVSVEGSAFPINTQVLYGML